ncbi:hypothetical protein D3C85_805960 [compost metagenome]
MDASVTIRYELALRAPEKHWDQWLDAQRDKIRRALGYLDLRHPDLNWRDAHPQLSAWYAQVSQRPSMLATVPKV